MLTSFLFNMKRPNELPLSYEPFWPRWQVKVKVEILSISGRKLPLIASAREERLQEVRLPVKDPSEHLRLSPRR